MTKQKYQNWRKVASVFGIFLVGVETLLNATASTVSGPISVIATVIITMAGAAAVPIAMRAWHAGSKPSAVALLVVFVPLVLVVSFVSGIERVGDKMDKAVNTGRADAKKELIAGSAYDAALAIKQRDCGATKKEYEKLGDTTSCRRAEKKLLELSGAYQDKITGSAGEFEHGTAKRIAAVLSFAGVSEESIQLYLPAVWPAALLTGGFLFIGLGFGHAPEVHEPVIVARTEPSVVVPEVGNIQKDAALAAVLELIRRGGGSLTIKSGRELAGMIGAAPASMALWLRQWESTHLLIVRAKGKLTITAARVRAVKLA